MPTMLRCPHCGHQYDNVYELIRDQPRTEAWLEDRRREARARGCRACGGAVRPPEHAMIIG